MSSKFNGVRKLRNRIFHHEPIFWNLKALLDYQHEIIQGIDWLNKNLIEWSNDLFHIEETILSRKA